MRILLADARQLSYTITMIPKHFAIATHYVQTFGLDSLIPELFSYTQMLEFLSKLNKLSFYTTGANSHYLVHPELFAQVLRIFAVDEKSRWLMERVQNEIGSNFVALGTDKSEFLKIVRFEDVATSLMGFDSSQIYTTLQKLGEKYQIDGRNTYNLISSTDLVVNVWDKRATSEALRWFHKMFSGHYVAL